MAEKQVKTTSGKTLNEIQHRNNVSPLMPNNGDLQIIDKLACNLNENSQLVKQRKPCIMKKDEISTNEAYIAPTSVPLDSDETLEWQEVCSTKNKLKRKKNLSSSLTSVADTVNQEKRTRIEGIQLNCRGRLQMHDSSNLPLHGPMIQDCQSGVKVNVQYSNKPLLSQGQSKQQQINVSIKETTGTINIDKVPVPRLKRKLEENVQTIKKLNTLTDHLRLEINELKTNLNTERGAVRLLRAQNESESRKWKSEVKKLQKDLDYLKKDNCRILKNNSENLPTGITAKAIGGNSLVNYEIQRLTNEIIALKEANKCLEEKKSINSDADRRKAADIRTLKDSYEIRLTQLSKSAKTEISRLLEEIKSKERSIGQLKNELQVLQTKSQQKNDLKKSRNATTKFSNKMTNTKTNIRPKNSITKNIKVDKTSSTDNKVDQKDVSQAQNLPELKQLEDTELTTHMKPVKTPKTSLKIPNISEDKLDAKNLRQKEITKAASEIMTPTTNSINMACVLHENEYHSMHVSLEKRRIETKEPLPLTNVTSKTETEILNKNAAKLENELETNMNGEVYIRLKDNSSDSDSALSSAPPSISPQPPSIDVDTTDIWQMIRTYSKDIDKLQKDIEFLQKENSQLHIELKLANELVMENENTVNIIKDDDANLHKLLDRIKILEEQEYRLIAESTELREQNELLEFRVLELEESNEKSSMQEYESSNSNKVRKIISESDSMSNVWCSDDSKKEDPMEMLFGTYASKEINIVVPDDEKKVEQRLNLTKTTSEDISFSLLNILQRFNLGDSEKHVLQRALKIIQQIDMSLIEDDLNNIKLSKYESNDLLDTAKSRNLNSKTGSLSPNIRFTDDNIKSLKNTKPNTNSRIVATIQPFNSSTELQVDQNLISVFNNTPTDSPRKVRQSWQNNSLSESGVFVESDFVSDAYERNVCTQTEFEDDFEVNVVRDFCFLETPKSQICDRKLSEKFSALSGYISSPDLNVLKRLQYYKERLDVLERKILIYESSGDLQTKRLADRLQREVQLENRLKELSARIEFLETQNNTLEEEKCEFEEAENDTRLRLQRLEVDLEIFSQRNVELEMSREALSAKYKDCRSECLILRDDLSVSETQIRHLEEDKLKAKENLDFINNILPILLIYNSCFGYGTSQIIRKLKNQQKITNMGNLPLIPLVPGSPDDAISTPRPGPISNSPIRPCPPCAMKVDNSSCQERELSYLKEEVKCLRHQMKEINARHYEAMETADSHWVDIEREYKDREETYRAKEVCLKQKIQKLQDCLRDDARAANEKILQLEEAENGLKSCVIRVSKENREIIDEHRNMCIEYERFKEQYEQLKEQQKPLIETLEQEKKQNKSLADELNFMRKLQQDSETRSSTEIESLRTQLFDLKKEYMHIEVTNSELKEEVATLEHQIEVMQRNEKDCVDKMRCLQDEVRSKEEMCEKMEKRLERSDGTSLADELNGSPSKRFKREDVKDLKTASKGLGVALRNMKNCDNVLPSHQEFRNVARDVKKLADALLNGDSIEDEVSNMSLALKEDVEEPENNNEGGANDAMATEDGENDGSLPIEETVVKEEDDIVDVDLPDKVEEPGDPLPDKDSAQDPSNEDATVTVGMVLVPEFTISESFLSPCSSKNKTEVYEVPSQLRKLSLKPIDCKPHKEAQILTHQICNKKRFRRKNKSSHFKNSNNSIQTLRVRRIMSCMSSSYKQNFYDLDDVEGSQSEILKRNVSYSSFHSVGEEYNEQDSAQKNEINKNAKVDAFTETETDRRDKETETYVEKKESYVQANDELSTERILHKLSFNSREFLNVLKNSVSRSVWEEQNMNWNFLKRWEADSDFRDGIEILQKFTIYDSSDSETNPIENYEFFVNAMSCLHALEELFKPLKISLLHQIEDRLNEELMNFHSRKMESEFYCTVYYPIKRQVPLDITDFIIK